MTENGKYFETTEILSYFLKDVRKYEVLTTEEEQKLIEKSAKGDKSARDKLINCNLLFIFSKAKEYARNKDEILDYVNEGVIGLMKGIENYDPTLGLKLMTYAKFYIQREMNYYFMNTKDMVVPANRAKIGRKLSKIKRKYYAEHGYDISPETLKAKMLSEYGIEINDNSDMDDVVLSSIDYEIDDDYTMEDNTEFNSRTASENDCEKNFEDERRKTLVKEMLKGVSPIEADIIKMLFKIGYNIEYSVEEIGMKHALEPETVEKIKNDVFRKIRSKYQKEEVI